MRNVLDFGADPTGQSDSFAAFHAACNDWPTLPGLHKYAGGRVYVPRGIYRLDAPLHLLRTITLCGEGPESSVITGHGLVSHNWKTALADLDTEGASAFSSIEALKIYRAAGHGFDMRAGCALRDVIIDECTGHGVLIDTHDPNRNANRFYLERVRSSKCTNGFHITGDDSNAGTLVNCDARSNREWGVWEQSFLGNCYVGLHVGYNQVGAVNSCRHTAKNAWINCYQEGSNVTHPICMTAGDVVVGGISFMANTIQTTPAGGKPVVINQWCSHLPIRAGDVEVTIGGDAVLAFRKIGDPHMYRLAFDDARKTLQLSHANMPARSVEFAADGHAQTPMTITKAAFGPGVLPT